MSDQHTEYLGDGVYASHDGYHVILDLRGQPEHNIHDPNNRVALEPAVWSRLVAYVDGLRQEAR